MVQEREGTVTDDSPLTITLGGASTDVEFVDVPYLASYTPTVSDRVAVLTWGNAILVLGEKA